MNLAPREVCVLKYDGCRDRLLHRCRVHDRQTGVMGPLGVTVCEDCCGQDTYLHGWKARDVSMVPDLPVYEEDR